MSKTMRELNENFISSARKSVIKQVGSRVPQHVIEPQTKWITSTDKSFIVKTFTFMSSDKRNEFVLHLLAREDHHRHAPLKVVIDDFADSCAVTVVLGTRDINAVTELDRELAKFCDVLYKDVVYSHVDARN